MSEEICKINIYLNERVWEFYKDIERIPLFLSFNIEEEKHLLTDKSFKDAVTFKAHTMWKMLTITVDPKIFEGREWITYYLFTEAWKKDGQYKAVVYLDDIDARPCFHDYKSRIRSYHCISNLFAEFIAFPKVWNIKNHFQWPTGFQKDAYITLLLLKRLGVYRDLKYPILNQLAQLYKK